MMKKQISAIMTRGLGLLLAAVLLLPFLEGLFLVEAMSPAQLGTVALLAFLPTVLIQAGKVIQDRHAK